MRALILGLACAVTPLMAQAQSYQSVNLLKVVPLNQTDFEVIEARGEGARGIWCAAADYASARVGMGKTGRIYVKSPRGPSVSGKGRKGVVFTTNAKAVDARTSYSVSVRQTGLGLPINHAIQFCKDYLIELEDIAVFWRINP